MWGSDTVDEEEGARGSIEDIGMWENVEERRKKLTKYQYLSSISFVSVLRLFFDGKGWCSFEAVIVAEKGRIVVNIWAFNWV